jgi:P22 tail accessory factor
MGTIAKKIIERAFSKAGIKTAEEPLTATEIVDGLEELNDLIESWNGDETLDGVPLVDDPDDEIKCTRQQAAALKANLTPILASEYEMPVTQSMIIDADDKLNSLIAATLDFTKIPYPSTLPMGSGNDTGYGIDNEYFDDDKERNF